MRIKTLARTLATTTGLSLVFLASSASAQLVNAGDLVTSQDSAGNPGQITISNPNASTANISVLAPVVVSNWSQLNVPVNTTLNISNASAAGQASLLARVIGGGFSDIGGTINAPNVNLWLLNQNGILFGGNTSVNASSFYVSTLALTDQDFFDFYEGTNIAGDGSGNIRFSGPPFSSTGIYGGGAGASFITNGNLVFVGPALDLDAEFNAQSGSVAFIAAADVSVSFTAGSPISYTINAGTTVANQRIDGTVLGRSADFIFANAAGVTNALLTIDADVATTATASASGIRLLAPQSAAITSNGNLASTGRVSAVTSNTFAANGSIQGSGVDLSAGSMNLGGVSATSGDVRLSTSTGNLSAGAVNATGAITFQTPNSQNATFASLIATGGPVAVSGYIPNALTVTGETRGSSVSLVSIGALNVGNVNSSGGLSLLSLNGSVTAKALTASGGNVSVNGETAVTATSVSATDSIDIRSEGGGTLTLGDLVAGTNISLDTAGALTFGNASAPTALAIGSIYAPISVGSSGVINTQTLSARTLGSLTLNGANTIARLGNISAGGPILLNSLSSLLVDGTVLAPGQDVTFKSGGNLSIGASGSVTGKVVALSGTGNFINNRGAGAISASDRWIVYASAPTGNTFGGLDSGNTALWNATIGTRAPGTISGNRYVFAYQPTLTVASTDTSKVYGTDLTGLLNGNYSVSGLEAGVAGAFLGDSLAVLTGSPSITSAGAVANADVAGGPYAMNVGQGSLAVSGGYQLVLSNAGRLTVTPKPINALVGANNKTYDGTTDATGTVTLGGVLAGDSVGTDGTTFTFSDKNAGVDKTVTVSGTILTGSDAGNYTLTVPTSVLADIFAKAISATVVVDNKTYDGTTAGTGSVALNGVVAGDTVSTSGTTYTFSDKNAGIGKTVAVAGTSLTGADAGNYTLSIPSSVLADIFAKAISATVVANNKTYDGTTDGTGSVTLNGVVAGDTVSTSGTTFTFSDKNAGTGKTVTVSGTTMNGADAGNYTLSVPSSVLADIFAKAISANVVATDKTYDGTTGGSGSVTLNGVVAGDTVSASGTIFTFADKNAGTDKTVAVSGTTLTGGDAGNYVLTVPSSVLADIFAKAISASANANDKTYDGTTAASGAVTLNGVVAGDTVGTTGTTFTFSDKNAGLGKTVIVAGTTLTGADAGNYTLSVPSSIIADIFAKAISATVTANNKTYDGTTTATGTVTLTGTVSGDMVETTGTTLAFSDKNAGTAKTVNVSGTTLTGADAGNYTLTIPSSVLADIFTKAVSATVTANNKTYDGTTTATGTVTLSGVVAGDDVGSAGTVYAFSDKNAGTGKTVSISGTTLTGSDAGNYTLTVPSSALADILQRALQITANNAGKVEGLADPALTFTVGAEGLVAGDTLSGALIRESGEAVGAYVINQGSLTGGSNYSITYTPGVFTIAEDVVGNAIKGQINPLRALPLPDQMASARRGSVEVSLSDLCPKDDSSCRAN